MNHDIHFQNNTKLTPTPQPGIIWVFNSAQEQILSKQTNWIW